MIEPTIDSPYQSRTSARCGGTDPLPRLPLRTGIMRTPHCLAKQPATEFNTGIHARATGSAQLLSAIMDRTPRQTNPVRNPANQQNMQAGDEGERRAAMLDGVPKQSVTENEHPVTVVPDLIDHRNQNVVENTNEIRPYPTQQIRAEAENAHQRGYTMTLLVDHPTQINDPQIQQMID